MFNTINDYIAFAESIPDEQWTTGQYGKEKGPNCFIGHLFYKQRCWPKPSVLMMCGFKSQDEAVDINDGNHPRYQQPTPKARILAALHDAKEKAESEAVT